MGLRTRLRGFVFLWLAIAACQSESVEPADSRASLPVEGDSGPSPLPASAPTPSSVDDPPSNAATSTVGATDGEFSVGQSGDASYAIALNLVPGTAGIQPELSLSYNSSGGDSPLGVGFMLGGQSAITRCASTFAQDAFVDSVDFDANDRFCLDGQRLVAVSGAYGADGTEYRTEVESFSRIRSYGAAPGGGPEKFLVHTNTGRILQYGYTVDARVESVLSGSSAPYPVSAWALNRVEDRLGNYMNYAYFEGASDAGQGQIGTEHYLTRIDYTGNTAAGLATYAAVRLEYEARPDVMAGYASGALSLWKVRLKRIVNVARSTTVRSYDLSYDPSSVAGRSQLSAIKECGSDGTCLNPTTLGNRKGTPGFAATSRVALAVGAAGNGLSNKSFNGQHESFADLDGDGDLDRVWIPDGLADFYVSLWRGTDFGPATKWAIPDQVSFSNLGAHEEWVDLNGDGKADRVWIPTKLRDLYVSLSTGSGLGAPQIWLRDGAAAGLPSFSEVGLRETFSDLNGDGRLDYIWVPEAGEGTVATYAALNTGSSFAAPIEVFPLHGPNLVNTSDSGRYEEYLDLNGDGLTDYAWIPNRGSATYVALGNAEPGHPARFDAPAVWLAEDSRPPLDARNLVNFRLYEDMTGDGLADLVFQRTSGECDEVRVAVNTGRTFLPSQMFARACAGQVAVDSTDARYQQFVDINDDGRADHVWVPSGQNSVWVAFNNGTTLGAPSELIRSSVGVMPKAQTDLYFDADGDGATDRVWIPEDAPNGAFHFLAGNNVSHLMESVTNAFGRELKITYRTLVDPNVYTQDHNAVFPVLDAGGPMVVVSHTSSSDGLGGGRNRSYRYEGLKMHVQGLGSLGMRRTIEFEDERVSSTIRDFSQDYARRLQGMLASGGTLHVKLGVPPSAPLPDHLVGTTNFANQFEVTVAGGIYRTRLLSTETFERDLYGDFMSRRTTENLAVDAYGNVTSLRMSTYDASGAVVARSVTTNTYDNDAASWSLGLLRRAEVTRSLPSTSPAVAPITRVTTQDWNVQTRLLTQEVVEPNDPIYRVTTKYDYDAFGNRIESTVTGDGVAPRVSTADYDPTGRFAVYSLNPLGQESSEKYDDVRALQLEATDLNQLTTKFQYDGFGRTILVTRPDGTHTSTDYVSCASGCPALAVFATTSKTDGAPPVTNYFDVLGREIRSESLSLEGNTLLKDRRYDVLGRGVAASEPYFLGDTVHWVEVGYDALDRSTSMSGPDDSSSSTSYRGNTTIDTNELTQKRTEVRNALGQVVRVVDHEGYALHFTYDPFDNVREIRDPQENRTQIVFDKLGRKLQLSDPDSGRSTYAYDALGQLVTQTDAKGQVTTYAYDDLGRMIQRFDHDGGATLWTYDTAEHGIGLLGRTAHTNCSGLSRTQCLEALESSPDYSETFGYDELARPLQQVTTIEDESFEVLSSYDSLGRVDEVTYPQGASNRLRIKNLYNGYGYRIEVRNAASGSSYWKATNTDARGNITLSTLGNGLVTERRFDPATGFITRIQTEIHGSLSAQQLAYEFDALGNLRLRRDELQNVEEAATYDTLNRLKTIETRLATGSQTTSASYDYLGNILSRSDVGDYLYGETCDGRKAGPHAVTSTGPHGTTTPTKYCYDANGNIIRSGERSVEYASFDKPTRFVQGQTETVFRYGHDRERYQRIDAASGGTTVTTYIGGLFERTEGPEGAIYRNFIGDFAVYTETVPTGAEPKAAVHYLHRDHLGSVDVITDAQARVVERFSFDAWGKRRNTDWTVATDPAALASDITLRGFTNQEQIDGFNLVHMNGRVYDPTIGRFLSADPFIQAPGNLQSYNRYSYVFNNPLSYTDPSGFFSFKKFVKTVFDYTVGKKSALGRSIRGVRSALRSVAKVWAKVPGLEAVVRGVVCTFGTPAACVAFGAFATAVQLSAGASLGELLTSNAIGLVAGGVAGGAVGIVSGGAQAVGLSLSSQAANLLAGGIAGGLSAEAQGGKFGDGFKAGVRGAAIGAVIRAVGPRPPPAPPQSRSEALIESGKIPALFAGPTKEEISAGVLDEMRSVLETASELKQLVRYDEERISMIDDIQDGLNNYDEGELRPAQEFFVGIVREVGGAAVSTALQIQKIAYQAESAIFQALYKRALYKADLKNKIYRLVTDDVAFVAVSYKKTQPYPLIQRGPPAL